MVGSVLIGLHITLVASARSMLMTLFCSLSDSVVKVYEMQAHAVSYLI